MASVRNLKKDINTIFGGIIDAVYVIENTSGEQVSKEGSKIIDEAINSFDDLIAKVNNKGVDNRRAHLQKVREELSKKAEALVDKVNALA
ncbi:MAG: hypothetical protein AB3N16_09680 [Flavobacteriaceae bacterium]